MSNLSRRVLTAAVAIPAIVFFCAEGGWIFLSFVEIAAGVALYEFYALARSKGARPLTGTGLAAGFAVILSFEHVKLRTALVGGLAERGISVPFPSQAQLLLIVLLLAMSVLAVRELFRNDGPALLNISATVAGILYVSLSFGTLVGLRELFVPQDFPVFRFFPPSGGVDGPETAANIYRWGGLTVVSVLVMIWVCDSAAYFVGRKFGSHKLFPRVSPNKSWEGSVAGFCAAILAALGLRSALLGYMTLTDAVVIGMIVGIVGQIGDLFESLLKRDAGVKDSSAIVPGHGGVLNRFDSLLLVSPLVYLYLDFIVFS